MITLLILLLKHSVFFLWDISFFNVIFLSKSFFFFFFLCCPERGTLVSWPGIRSMSPAGLWGLNWGAPFVLAVMQGAAGASGAALLFICSLTACRVLLPAEFTLHGDHQDCFIFLGRNSHSSRQPTRGARTKSVRQEHSQQHKVPYVGGVGWGRQTHRDRDRDGHSEPDGWRRNRLKETNKQKQEVT